MPEPLVIVFDTSVLIPLILPASRSTVLFHRLRSNGHRVALTELVYVELEDKLRNREILRRWMQRSDDEITQFLTDLRTNCYLLPGFREVYAAVPADPKDDIIIAAALEANASYIVSEDRHLLDLQAYESITIVSRKQFAAELDRLGVPQ